ncbi:MAG: hypothetical protein DKM23_05270 [Candidatus Melainabacteria bacterium]|nr:MAG: hypothetical protein DKM23_05270 [Candidatus Melainabacteria bacterium]
MVQGINWNSYSANQILEMKQKGVQVPDDVLKKAESSISEKDTKEITSESNDEKNVEYDVTDDTQNIDSSEYKSKIQDVADFKKQLEEEGASLKSMVKQFTTKANENTTMLTASLEELSMFTDFIAEKQDIATETQAQAEKEQAEVQATAEKITQEIEKKQDEIETINDKVDSGEATEEDKTKAKNLQGEIQTIADNGNATITAKEAVVADLNTETATTMSDLEALTKLVKEDSTDAQKGIDFAKETHDLSNKLYKKGSKAGKIGTIAGSVIGGAVGGFSMSKVKIVHNDVGLTNTTAKSNIGLNIGGGISGASIMGSLGSLFGSKNRKIGQAGMDAANKLNQVATNQINTAQVIANNNDIAINATTDADSAVTDLSGIIKDAENTDIKTEPEPTDKTLDVTNEDNKTTETPVAKGETEVEDENKKKKEA